MELHELSFDWDQWNIQKNEIKHGIAKREAESVFFDPFLVIFDDEKHSSSRESRWICYGVSKQSRIVMIAFTIRANQIRVISARTASKKERTIYEKNKEQ
jgi:uncharacterized DUF497 family protein